MLVPLIIKNRMYKSLLVLLFITPTLFVTAQRLVTRTGYISFYSKTLLEDIKAENRQVNAVVDLEKKNLAFITLMKGFLFPRALMQEHFNENYIESDQYPKASFSGSYTGDIDKTKEGIYNVTVKGDLTMHGVSKTIEVPAAFEVKGGNLTGRANFKILPADFNIKIPALVKNKIAREIDVTVQIQYKM